MKVEMDMYYLIRSYHNDGMSIRAVAKHLAYQDRQSRSIVMELLSQVIEKNTIGIQQLSLTRHVNSFCPASEKMSRKVLPSSGILLNVFMIALSLKKDSPEVNPP